MKASICQGSQKRAFIFLRMDLNGNYSFFLMLKWLYYVTAYHLEEYIKRQLSFAAKGHFKSTETQET